MTIEKWKEPKLIFALIFSVIAFVHSKTNDTEEANYPKGVQDCGSQVGKFTNFKIQQCQPGGAIECKLYRSKNATIDVDVTPSKDVKAVTVVIRGIIMRINIPFEFKYENACRYGGLTCPLTKGQTYHYHGKWYTGEVPSFPLLLRWYLYDEQNQAISCSQLQTIFK